jgi:hypothetical protein
MRQSFPGLGRRGDAEPIEADRENGLEGETEMDDDRYNDSAIDGSAWVSGETDRNDGKHEYDHIDAPLVDCHDEGSREREDLDSGVQPLEHARRRCSMKRGPA